MSNKEILEKAIQKAIEGGWAGCYVMHSTTKHWLITGRPELCVEFTTGSNAYFHPSTFIFDHDFAKALWGEDHVYRADCIESPEEGAAGFQEDYSAWEFHLREMIIAPDPIKYLGENI